MSNYYGNYNRKKKGSALQTVVCILLVIILLGVIAGGIFVGVKSDGFKNWDYFKGEQAEQTVPEEGSGVTDGEGNELESGTSYEMPASMVYAVPTAQSTTAADGVTVTATVLPETAINKNVTWSLAFADASASWAQGKTVTDYVTVTADAENSREATVVCKQAFGEQIVLTAASVADPSKTATCTIDYAQSLVSYTLSFGSVVCNFDGDTDVTMELDANAASIPGGLPEEEIVKNEVYTIADEYTVSYKLTGHKFMTLSGSMQGVNKYFMFGEVIDHEEVYADFTYYDLFGKGLYFGLKWMSENMQLNHVSWGMGMATTVSADLTTSDEFIERFTNAGRQIQQDGSQMVYTYGTDMDLLDLEVTVEGTYVSRVFETTFVLANYSNADTIHSVQIDPPSIVF